MDKNLCNISKIETFVDTLLRGKLSANVFPTQPPSKIASSWKEFVVYDITANDMEGRGMGMINIFLYTKPIGSSMSKDVKTLSKMEETLNELIKGNDSEHYLISRYRTYPDYDSARNLYVNIVSVLLQIV